MQVPLPIVPVWTVNPFENLPVASVVVDARLLVSQPGGPLRFAHSARNRLMFAGSPDPETVTVAPFVSPVDGEALAEGAAKAGTSAAARTNPTDTTKRPVAMPQRSTRERPWVGTTFRLLESQRDDERPRRFGSETCLTSDTNTRTIFEPGPMTPFLTHVESA